MQLQYDRGTLLLNGTPTGWSPAAGSGFVWDERVRAFRAPASYYSDFLNLLKNSEEGFQLDDQVRARNSMPVENWTSVPLRPYQETAQELWEMSNLRGIVVLPTGAGKTRLALAIAAKLKTETLCLVPTRALLQQWCTEISKFYSGEIGRQGDGTHTLESITVSTYESAYRRIGEFGNRFKLLVIDECHHFGSGMKSEILEASTACHRLGLTATLPSAEDWLKSLTHQIAVRLSPNRNWKSWVWFFSLNEESKFLEFCPKSRLK
jgi:superfamily II DNA or RNA helicase